MVLTLLSLLSFATDPANKGAADTVGSDVSVGVNGHIEQRVPLAFPDERSGLPVPVQIAFGVGGTRDVLGRGFMLGLSTVSASGIDGAAPGINPITVDLLGVRSIVRADAEVASVRRYVPSATGAFFELYYEEKLDLFTLVDTEGRRFLFTRHAFLPATSVWLLTAILDLTGENRIDLSYDVTEDTDPRLPHDIALRSVSYDYAPNTTCPKFTIDLRYQRQPAPFAYASYFGVVRSFERLLTTIDITATPDTTCRDRRVISRYELSYRNTTSLPELSRVTSAGLDGAESRPLLELDYVNTADDLRLDDVQKFPVAFPSHLGPALFATDREGDRNNVTASLRDFDGDGRLDYLYAANKDHTNLQLLPHAITAHGVHALGPAPVDLFNAANDVIARDASYGVELDWNGDGRLDFIGVAPFDPIVDRAPARILVNLPTASTSPTFGAIDTFTASRTCRVTVSSPSSATGATSDDDPDGGLVDQSTGSVDMACAAPFERTFVAIHNHYSRCFVYTEDAQSGRLVRQPCAGYDADPRWHMRRELVTLSTWRDVNGDGYPDYVYVDREPTRRQVTGFCEQTSCPTSVATQADVPQSCLTPCHDAYDKDLEESAAIFAVLNPGNEATQPGTPALSTPTALASWRQIALRYDTGCGIARQREAVYDDFTAQLLCKLGDVNGDGALDYMETTSAGVSVDLGTRVSYGDTVFRNHSRIAIPGPVALAHDDGGRCPERGPQGWGTSGTYDYERLTDLLDLTGDGIVDYVFKDEGSKRWFVMRGTGAGFEPATEVSSAVDGGFALQLEQRDCAGIKNRTLATAVDFDGDGRTDIVRALPGFIAVGRARAVGDGLLSRVSDGIGLARRFSYASAKEDIFDHRVPEPEIVLAQVQTDVFGPIEGATPALQTFAHYGKQRYFYPTLGRFVSSPYRYSMALTLRPRTPTSKDSAPFEGFGRFTKRVGPETFSGPERYLLVGAEQERYALAGTFASTSPWGFLPQGVPFDPRTHTGTVSTQTTKRRLVGMTPTGAVCADDADPYSYAPPTTAELEACAEAVIVTPATLSTWDGDTAPGVTTRQLETRRRVLATDDYGRVTEEANDNDLYDLTDDVCTSSTFAAPSVVTFMRRHSLDTPASVRVHDCKRTTLSQARTTYDGLPLGQLTLGLQSGAGHDVFQQGALLNRYDDVLSIERTARGNVRRVIHRNYGAGTTQVQTRTVTFDPFELMPSTEWEEGSDVAWVSATAYDYEPYRMLRTAVISPDGVTRFAHFDARGRLDTSWESTASGSRFLAATRYLGDDAPSTEGRRIEETLALESIPWTPTAATPTQGVQRVVSYRDALDRPRFGLIELGADYQNASLRLGYTRRDAFGRVVFAADSHEATASPTLAYGTSTFYDSRGRVECEARAPGETAPLTASAPSAGIAVGCVTHSYVDHGYRAVVAGPAETTPGSAQAGAVDLYTSTAIGRTTTLAREQNGVAIEHATYGYDALGRRTSVTRRRDPAVPTSVTARWTYDIDSAGRTVLAREPGTKDLSYAYDSDGHLLSATYRDDNGVLRTTRYTYDALGRKLSEVVERQTIPPTLERETRWIHDRACDVSVHDVSTDHLAGRLACTVSTQTATGGGLAGTSSTFYAYDDRGHVARIVRNAGDPRWVTEHFSYALDRPTTLSLQLADTSYAIERLQYGYDSAGRLRTIDYVEPTRSGRIWSTKYDALGRPLRVALANGVSDTRTYRADQRRELQGQSITGPGFAYRIDDGPYDAAARVTSQIFTGPTQATAPRYATYRYDARNRLAEVDVRLSSAAGPVVTREAFSYNALGALQWRRDMQSGLYTTFGADALDPDRVCRTAVSTTQQTLSTNACDHRYDERGNLLSWPGNTFAYSSDGHALQATRGTQQLRWRIDAGSAAEVQETNSSGIVRREWRYGANVSRVMEVNGGDQIERRIHGPQGLIMIQRGTGAAATRSFVHESRGHNHLFTSQTGDVIEWREYGAFGAKVLGAGSEGQLGFRREQWNAVPRSEAVGVDEMGARLYSPELARFVQRDPLVRATNAMGMAPYAFASNDPVNNRDPSGFDDTSSKAPLLTPFITDDAHVAMRLPSGMLFQFPDKVLNIDNYGDGASASAASASPEKVNITWLATGDAKSAGWAPSYPGASTVPINTTFELAMFVHGQLKPGQKVGLLNLVAHGRPATQYGYSRPLVVDSLFGRMGLLALSGVVERIRLGGCQVVLGPDGEAYAQLWADLTGAEVEGVTSYNWPTLGTHQGLFRSRRPGQAVDEAAIRTEQVIDHLLYFDAPSPTVPGNMFFESNISIAAKLLTGSSLIPGEGPRGRRIKALRGHPLFSAIRDRLNDAIAHGKVSADDLKILRDLNGDGTWLLDR